MADKVIKGTKDRKMSVVKGAKDIRAIRCPNCNGVATQAPDGKGGILCACPSCGKKFKFASM